MLLKITVCGLESSSIVLSTMASSVGRSLIGMTVSVKESDAVATPSLTVTVIVAVPERSPAGGIVNVRSVPLPPKARLPFGTRA